ncbi:MAG: DUF3426 domain-containing protein [Thermodesulfobacteriota bacterium]
MTITCPKCSTKFYLDEDRVPDGGAKVRCSRCQHVFQAEKHAPPVQPSPAVEIPAEEFSREMEEWPQPKRRPARGFPFLTWMIVILVLTGLGYGAFVIWDKSTELQKAGITFSSLKQYLGLRDEKDGFIALEKLRGYYVEDPKFNRVFVIEGVAINQWGESRSFIRVKGTLLDAKGAKVEEKTVFCGNILSEKDLKEMSREAIEKSLSSQFGISFSNVNIPPGKSVPFMIVFIDSSSAGPGEKPAQGPYGKPGEVLPGPSAFTVEVAGSQKGSK